METALLQPSARFYCGNLVIDLQRHEIARGSEAIHLRRIEWAVLEVLLKTPGEVLTQASIIEAVWGQADKGRRASLHVTINHLRRKLEAQGSEKPLIVTVPGVGYRILNLVSD